MRVAVGALTHLVRELLSAPLPCRHAHLWQERRPDRRGVQVLHFVCRCGYAVPILKRDDPPAREDFTPLRVR